MLAGFAWAQNVPNGGVALALEEGQEKSIASLAVAVVVVAAELRIFVLFLFVAVVVVAAAAAADIKSVVVAALNDVALAGAAGAAKGDDDLAEGENVG